MNVRRKTNSREVGLSSAHGRDDDARSLILLESALPFAVLGLARREGTIVIDYVSESCRHVWHKSREEIGSSFERLLESFHPDDVDEVRVALSKGELSDAEWSITVRVLDPDGTARWTLVRGIPFDGVTVGRWSILVTDVSAQLRAVADLQTSESRLRALAESIPGVAFHSLTDSSGSQTMSFLSAACEEIWELDSGRIREHPEILWEMVVAEDTPPLRASLDASAETQSAWFHRWRILTPSGRMKWLEGRAQPERTADGGVSWNGLILDVTDQLRQEEEIRHLAEYDDLTGLANRTLLRQRLTETLAASQKDGAFGALLLLDLAGFRDINDRLGYDAGDAFLRITAERLRGFAKTEELVARLGGNEFGLVMTDIANAEELQVEINRIAAGLSHPTVIEERVVSTGVAIGAALMPRDGPTTDALMRHANIALHEAKATGRPSFMLYTPEMSIVRERRRKLADSLRADIDRHAVDIAFQPIVDTHTGAHRGFEALARWTLNGSAVAPSEFIPLAEEAGLAVELGQLLMIQSLRRAARLRSSAGDPGPISVNVSASQLRDDGFVATVETLIREFDHPPEALEIEVTETVILGPWADMIAATLRKLRGLGIRIALDDFGTGYASLAHLKKFRVDRLKIDRSFISEIETQPDDEVIVKAIIGLADALGMDVVAEGVETDDQRDFLRRYGCPCSQGYLFGRPTCDDAELTAYLSTRQASH
ncbi:putative bifunctional diguanylate cyclase/phosphodiesterase [Stappia sp. ICDLI1TA098]